MIPECVVLVDMVGKKIPFIVLGIENRIELVKEGRGVFSRKFILESGLYFGGVLWIPRRMSN